MRVKIEPTATEGPCSAAVRRQRAVIVEVPANDLTVFEVWAELIRPALVAYGFSERSIDQVSELCSDML